MDLKTASNSMTLQRILILGTFVDFTPISSFASLNWGKMILHCFNLYFLMIEFEYHFSDSILSFLLYKSSIHIFAHFSIGVAIFFLCNCSCMFYILVPDQFGWYTFLCNYSFGKSSIFFLFFQSWLSFLLDVYSSREMIKYVNNQVEFLLWFQRICRLFGRELTCSYCVPI